jgi:hypothetical protein
MGKKAIIDVVVNDGQAVKSTENLNKGFKKVDKSVEDTNKSMDGLVGKLDDMTNGAVSGFKNLVSGAKSGVGAMKSLKFAIAATGIGALLLTITSLVSYFNKTESGANRLKEAFAAMGAAVRVVIDRVLALGDGLLSLLSGDFSGGVEKLKGAFSGLGDEIARETKGAYELQKALNDLEIRERQLNVERAKANAEIERQKFLAEDTTRTIQERSEAAKAALALEQEFLQKDIALQAEKVRILKAQSEFAENSIEENQALADAEVRLSELRQQSTTKQIELNNKLNGLNREAQANAEAAWEIEQEREAKRQEERNKRLDDMIAELEMEEEQRQARLEREALDRELLAEVQMSEQEREIALEAQKYDRLLELAEYYGEETAGIEAQKTAALSSINKKYADYQDQLAQAAIQKKQAEENAKLNIVGGALGAAAGLAAEGSDLAKGLAVAAATIQTYQAAVAAYSSASAISVVGWVLGPVAAAVAVAAGLANVKNIVSAKTPKPSGKLASYASGSGGGSASSAVPSAAGAASAPVAPQFNLTGGNNQLNQINDSINTRNNQPQKSYVVGSEVSSEQELDRKIASNATF